MSQLSDLRDRHYEAVNSGDAEAAASVMAPDIENQFPGAPAGAMNGVAGFKMFFGPFVKAFPGARISISNSLETGDSIITEGTYHGIHTGPLDGPQGTVPATGRTIELPFVDIFRVRDGKFVSHHLYFDQVAFLAQLGLIPGGAS